MDGWTSRALANATPEQVLEVLTHPGEIRRWSPVEFYTEDLDCRPLAAGTRTKVTGRVAGVPVSFDVEVHVGKGLPGYRIPRSDVHGQLMALVDLEALVNRLSGEEGAARYDDGKP